MQTITPKKTLRKTLLGVFLFLSTFAIFNIAYAQSNYQKTCTPLSGSNGRNSQCEAWQDYPQYPGVKHLYAYFNDTDGTLPQNQAYNWYDIVDKIVYNLNYADTQANLQLNRTTCDLLHDHVEASTYRVTDGNCTGSNRFKMNTPFGESYISVDVTYNKSNQTVTWEFGKYKGQETSSDGKIEYFAEKPIISGKNPYVDQNTVTNDRMRMFEFGINMITKDVIGKNDWQITTTATAYTHTLRYHRANGVWEKFSNTASDVTPLGKEITHWRRTNVQTPTPTPPTPTPQIPPICAELKIIQPTQPINNPSASNRIQIETTDQFGRVWNGNYRYSTQSGTGVFINATTSSSSGTSGNFTGNQSLGSGVFGGGFVTTNGGFSSLASGSNPLNTTSKLVDFSGGKYDDWILVEDISRPTVCRAFLRIPEAPKPQCLSLNINPSGTINTTSLPYTQRVSVGSTFSNQGNYQAKYRWNITPSNANAYIITPTGQKVKFYEGTETSLNVEYNDTAIEAILTVAEISDQQRCIKTLKFTPPPVCTSLILNPNGSKQLAGSDLPFSQTMSVDATFSKTNNNPQFIWQISGDNTALIDGNKTASGAQKSRTFTYNGSSSATITVSEASNPNICKQTFTVVPPQVGTCTGITLTPDLGTVKATSYPYKVTLSASARFTNNLNQKAAFRWEVTNSNATVNGKSSVEGVDTVEFIANGPAGIRVIELTDPGLCQASMGVLNEENFCRNLKATFNGQDPFTTLPQREFPYDVTVNVSEVNPEYPDLPFTEQLIYRTPRGATNPTQIRNFTYRATGPGQIEVIDESNPIDCRAVITIPDAPKKKVCENIKITPDKMKPGEKKTFTIESTPSDFEGTFTFTAPDDCTRYTGGGQGVFSTSNKSVEIEALKRCTIQVTTKNKDGEIEEDCNATITMEEDTPVLCTDIDVSYYEDGQKIPSGTNPATKNFPRNFKVKVDAIYTTDDSNKSYIPEYEYYFIPRSGNASVNGPTGDMEKDFVANGPGVLGVRVTSPQYGSCESSITIPAIPGENACTGLNISETSLKIGETKQSILTINPDTYPADYIFTSQTDECAEINGELLTAGYRKEIRSSGGQTNFTVKGNKVCSVSVSTVDRNTGTIQPQCSGVINITGGSTGSNDCQNLNLSPSTFAAGSTQLVTFQANPAKAYKYIISANQANCATIKDGAIEKTIGGSETYTTEEGTTKQILVTGHTSSCKITVETIDVNKNNEIAPQCRGEIVFTGGSCCGGGGSSPTPSPSTPGGGGGGSPTPSPSTPGGGGGGSKTFTDEITKSVNKQVIDKPDNEGRSRVEYKIKYEITRSDYERLGVNGEDTYGYTIRFDDTLGRDVRPNNGGNKGVAKGRIPSSRLTPSENYIEYGGNFKAYVVNRDESLKEIPLCSDEESEKENCYTGEIQSGEINGSNTLTFHKITFPDRNNRTIIFSYDGIVNWRDYGLCDRNKVADPLRPSVNEECPGDKFDNEVREINNLESNIEDADATVYVLCPYILTRDGGDVFFEEGPLTGIDVSCIDNRFRNSDGIVIVGDKKIRVGLISSGAGSSTASSCDNGSYEKNLVNHFSSFICEVRITPQKDWQITNIELSMNENKERVSRFVKSKLDEQRQVSSNIRTENTKTEKISFTSIEALDNYFNKPNNYNNVYFFKKGNLVLTAPGLDNTIKVPALSDFNKNSSAARTIIIEEGDLILNSNIVYEVPTKITNNRQRPTIAFIVLNGNIQVDKSVGRLDGIYFVSNTKNEELLKENPAQSTNKGHFVCTENTTVNGKIRCSDSESTNRQLVINGAVFGDIDVLGKSRNHVDSPSKDGGAIVIRYDENLLLNPPAGIEEYLKSGWEREAR